MPENKLKVGIIGGAGMTGSELIRWIVNHPRLELTFVHSRHFAGKPIAQVHTYLNGMIDQSFVGDDPEKIVSSVDAVFLALGHTESSELYPRIEDFKGRLIDLTADHRLSESFTYGISELNRVKLGISKRIANPGCFATAAILSAAPFAASDLVESTYFFSSVTGSSGAGIKPQATTHHPYREGNLFAYKLFSHQHEREIQHTLQHLGVSEPNVILTTHSGPFVRGIHSTLHLRAKEIWPIEKWTNILRTYYENSPFIRVLDSPPNMKNVIGSNFCDIHVMSRNQDVIVISVLDNLVKGAAGQAIQNLNLSMDWSEKEGLWRTPIFP